MLNHLFAAVFVVLAVYYAARLVTAGRGDGHPDRVGDIAHLLMAVGMAAMFAPSVNPVPQPVWIAVFALCGAWLAAALLRADPATPSGQADRGHRVHLVISNVAMVYMLTMMGGSAAVPADALALPASGVVLAHDHGGGGLDLSFLMVAFAGYFLLHALWSLTRLARPTPAAACAATGPLFGPRLTGCCHVLMGLGMGYMFAAMLG